LPAFKEEQAIYGVAGEKHGGRCCVANDLINRQIRLSAMPRYPQQKRPVCRNAIESADKAGTFGKQIMSEVVFFVYRPE
jgi:hypothetical protein